MKVHIKEHFAFYALFLMYGLIGLLTLTKYPYIHQDEGLLSNLAKVFYEQGLSFQDPNLSYLGAFKNAAYFPVSGILYILTLALFGKMGMGFTLFMMRLHALFFSVLVLILTYQIGLKLFSSKMKSFWAVVLVAFSLQFIIVAHTVRQESMLIAALLAAFYFFIQGMQQKNLKWLCLVGFITGSSVSIHPNGILFPVIFLALYLWENFDSRQKIKIRSLLIIFIFVVLGYAVFFCFDYWPHRHEYFQLLASDPIDKVMHRRDSNPILDFFYATWMSFWTPKYHRHVLYLAVYVLTLIGFFYSRKNSENKLLVKMIILIALMLIPLHSNRHYLVYFTPFFGLLTASIAYDFWMRFKSGEKLIKFMAFRFFIVMVIAFYAFLPVVDLWAYRHYDHVEEMNNISKALPKSENFLGSTVYFFTLPPERLYAGNLATGYELSKLMKEIAVKYVIYDSEARQYFSKDNHFPEMSAANGKYFMETCHSVAHANKYTPSIFSPKYNGDPIDLYKCSGD